LLNKVLYKPGQYEGEEHKSLVDKFATTLSRATTVIGEEYIAENGSGVLSIPTTT
jgi:hypothetical protein